MRLAEYLKHADITQVLMQLPQEVRPDVLVVADDHFVGDVTEALTRDVLTVRMSLSGPRFATTLP
jgi:hypothetical protein